MQSPVDDAEEAQTGLGALIPSEGMSTPLSNVQEATQVTTSAIGTNHKGSRLLNINCQ
jgi:hypothetical protein